MPCETLVISPANNGRVDLNSLIHRELQAEGRVSCLDHRINVLVNRQNMTGAERGFAGAYQGEDVRSGEGGDMIRFSRRSKKYGIDRGDYARVEAVDFKSNTIMVRFENGRKLTSDPRRLQGVSVYRDSVRDFAEGDRVQFRASLDAIGKAKSQVVNGELGVIRRIDGHEFQIETESGRLFSVDVTIFRHLDHGSAVTSHSSQGRTVDRVIINADTRENAVLLNRRMAYVALSRAREDGLIFTNSVAELSGALDRRQVKMMSLETLSTSVQYRQSPLQEAHPGPEIMPSHQHQEPQYQPEPGFNLKL